MTLKSAWIVLVLKMENGEEENQYDISITVTEPQKMGDGMSAYMVYRVVTKVRKCLLTFLDNDRDFPECSYQLYIDLFEHHRGARPLHINRQKQKKDFWSVPCYICCFIPYPGIICGLLQRV